MLKITENETKGFERGHYKKKHAAGLL